jgi:hypothetical protein
MTRHKVTRPKLRMRIKSLHKQTKQSALKFCKKHGGYGPCQKCLDNDHWEDYVYESYYDK